MSHNDIIHKYLIDFQVEALFLLLSPLISDQDDQKDYVEKVQNILKKPSL